MFWHSLCRKLFGKASTVEPVAPPAPPSPRFPREPDHLTREPGGLMRQLDEILVRLEETLPRVASGEAADSMDCADGGIGATLAPGATLYGDQAPNLSEVVVGFFLRQTFIGHQLAALLSQHWLVAKCCWMPANDAVRKGFTISTPEGDDAPVVELLERWNKRMKLRQNMTEFVGFGRVFGVRLAIFNVEHEDEKYFEYPFDPDQVKPGSYRGIIQVDPYWCIPELDQVSTADPDSMHFYDPTWWIINGKRYHRSHLCIYREGDVPDILKPSYLYGGIPVPQRIIERIYAAERVANEGPELAMAKRLIGLKTDLEQILAGGPEAYAQLNRWTQLMTNFGVKVIGTDEDIQVHDTSLADFDALTMTEFQLVAAAAEVPATKLLGTSPKGFGASGDYEIESYHETLESLQEGALRDLVEGHIERLMHSEVLPMLRTKMPDYEMPHLDVAFKPLDTPTTEEIARINLTNAQAAAALVSVGALDGVDVRDRLIADPQSGYAGIPGAYRPDEEPVEGKIPAPVNPAQADPSPSDSNFYGGE